MSIFGHTPWHIGKDEYKAYEPHRDDEQTCGNEEVDRTQKNSDKHLENLEENDPDDLGSIGCNLSNHPGIGFFYTVLTKIKADNRVQDILVEIHELPEDEQDWPFSERIYLLANATIDTIKRWVSPLEPDEISLGWFSKPPKIAPKLKPGYKVFNIWWD